MDKAVALLDEKKDKLAKLTQLYKALKHGKELKGSLKQFAKDKKAPRTPESC